MDHPFGTTIPFEGNRNICASISSWALILCSELLSRLKGMYLLSAIGYQQSEKRSIQIWYTLCYFIFALPVEPNWNGRLEEWKSKNYYPVWRESKLLNSNFGGVCLTFDVRNYYPVGRESKLISSSSSSSGISVRNYYPVGREWKLFWKLILPKHNKQVRNYFPVWRESKLLRIRKIKVRRISCSELLSRWKGIETQLGKKPSWYIQVACGLG